MAEMLANQVTEFAHIWDNAARVRELANARAAWRLRRKRLIASRAWKLLSSLTLLSLGAALGAYCVYQLRPTQVIQHAVYTIEAAPMAAMASIAASEPPSDMKQAETLTAAEGEPHSSSMKKELEKYKRRAKATSRATENSVSAKATPAAQVALPPAPSASAVEEKPRSVSSIYEAPQAVQAPAAKKIEPSLRVVNVPIDGLLNLDVQGSVRSYKVGERLPDGSVLQNADAKTGKFSTTTLRN